jgi:hypothetical protein
MTTVLSSMSFGVAGRHGCKPRECIFGLNPRPASVLGEALTNLRIVRWGGHPWTTKEVEERLNALGFERFEAVLPSPRFCLCSVKNRLGMGALPREPGIHVSET